MRSSCDNIQALFFFTWRDMLLLIVTPGEVRAHCHWGHMALSLSAARFLLVLEIDVYLWMKRPVSLRASMRTRTGASPTAVLTAVLPPLHPCQRWGLQGVLVPSHLRWRASGAWSGPTVQP